jgi:flagellar protein FlaG
MDTLKAVSAHPSQGSATVQAPTKNDEEPGGSVSAVTTATTAIPVRLPEPKDQANKQQISSAVKDISSFFQAEQRSLAFSLDTDSGQLVMQIRDIKTNELIRQIPGEDVLKLAKRLDDLTGVLFKAQA